MFSNTLYIKKVKALFTHLANRPYYNDVLKGKFKVLDSNGLVLFDNTHLTDDNSKIVGNRFFSIPNNRYMLTYNDYDLCNTNGTINISFIDSTYTKLKWNYYRNEIVTVDCPYYNTAIPQPLPEEIVLTKQ